MSVSAVILSGSGDPALLGDILGEDDPALSHATDIEAVYAHLDELPEREGTSSVPAAFVNESITYLVPSRVFYTGGCGHGLSASDEA
jgi:hypothetical protein